MVIKISQKVAKDAVRQAQSRAPRKRTAWWAPKEGDNVIRVFAFLRGDRSPDDEDAGQFFREVWTHPGTGQGPNLCQKTPARTGEARRGECEFCEAADRRYAEVLAQTDDKKKARDASNRMQSRPRYTFIIVPIREGDKDVDPKYRRPATWQASKLTGEAIINKILDPDYGGPEVWLGPNGRNFKINYSKRRDPASMYEVSPMDREVSKPLPDAEELQKQAQALDLYTDDNNEPQWFLDEYANGPDDGETTDTTGETGDEGLTPADHDAMKHAALTRLAEAGIAADWEVEIAHNGHEYAACYYPKGSNDGTWDFPGDAK